jgi:hypothetical protein
MVVKKFCVPERCFSNVPMKFMDFYINKTPSAFANGVSEFNLDDDLLSHGETPHYHRRCIVSLLSSGWDQVVPMLYGRQEIRVLSRGQLASLQQIGYVTAFGVL